MDRLGLSPGLGGFRLAHLLLEHDAEVVVDRLGLSPGLGGFRLAHLLLEHDAEVVVDRLGLSPGLGGFRLAHLLLEHDAEVVVDRLGLSPGLGGFRLRVVTRPVRLPPHLPGLAIPSFKPHSGSGPPGKQIISTMNSSGSGQFWIALGQPSGMHMRQGATRS